MNKYLLNEKKKSAQNLKNINLAVTYAKELFIIVICIMKFKKQQQMKKLNNLRFCKLYKTHIQYP